MPSQPAAHNGWSAAAAACSLPIAGIAAVVTSKNCAPPALTKTMLICAQDQLGLFGCGCFWELAGWSVLIPGLLRRVEKFAILCPASGVGARTLKQAIPFSHQHVYYFLHGLRWGVSNLYFFFRSTLKSHFDACKFSSGYTRRGSTLYCSES
jgi:hypothetical protein